MSISSTLVHGADIRFQEAADALRPYVGCFWVITAERDAIIRVVRDGSTAISIQLQKTRPAEWSLRGPLLRPDERRFKVPADRRSPDHPIADELFTLHIHRLRLACEGWVTRPVAHRRDPSTVACDPL